MHLVFLSHCKNLKVYLDLMLVILIAPFSLWSQENTIFLNQATAEKIYLQIDKKAYTIDETIWFKAIVTDAAEHIPTKLSGVLYVEIIGSDEMLMEKKLLKIENGKSDGFFELHQNYSEGIYLIRAYTEWNKNFGSDFFFEEYIQIFKFSKTDQKDSFYKVILDESHQKNRSLEVRFDPFVIDSLHKKNLVLYLTLDKKKDTLLIKKNKNNRYEIDYPIDQESQFVTFQIKTTNTTSASKTIVLDENYIDLQFFPESGDLVHGIKSKVGFKALDASGQGKFIAGDIVNDYGRIIAKFKSDHLGMGSFMLTKVDSSDSYFAKLSSVIENNVSIMVPLPEIAQQGNVLTVSKMGDNIGIKIISNYLVNDSVQLLASCRGIDYFEVKGRLKRGILNVSLPSKGLPEGIIAFKMMDRFAHPILERLYFNERSEDRLNLSLKTNKKSYVQRELTGLTIKTTNNIGEAVNANLSLLVINREELGEMQTSRQNILSYFLLSSDLKGNIESPGVYFDKNNANRSTQLDNLLLTQGWRKYHYKKQVESLNHAPERSLMISGNVSRALFQRKKKKVNLMLLTFGEPKSIYTQLSDTLGRFEFDIDNEYGKSLTFLLQTSNKSGKKKEYSIDLDEKTTPVVDFNQIKTIEKIDSITYALIDNNTERKLVDEAFLMSTGTTELDEVVLNTFALTPERIKVNKRWGEADKVITGKAIKEKEKEWSYGLYSVLLFSFPHEIEINRIDSNLYAQVFDSPGYTLVVIDGIPVMDYDYPLIQKIPPSEVTSFEIIKNAKNFTNLALTVIPDIEIEELKYYNQGNVLAIYTERGKGLHGAQESSGIKSNTVPVYSPKREFYAPKYDKLPKDEFIKPDLRALVYWEPLVEIKDSGEISKTFYNSDKIGEILIVVEAISDHGEIGYKELIYEVNKRQVNDD